MMDLWVWRKADEPDEPEDGDTKPAYTRGCRAQVAVYPEARTANHEKAGIVPSASVSAITHEKGIRVGDFLGGPSEPRYRVVSVAEYRTTTSLTLEEFAPREVARWHGTSR